MVRGRAAPRAFHILTEAYPALAKVVALGGFDRLDEAADVPPSMEYCPIQSIRETL
jgi:hypothetical protein